MRIRRLFRLLVFFLLPVAGAAADGAQLERVPDRQGNPPAMQKGAATYVEACLACHGLSLVRYRSLVDLGLGEQDVKDRLMAPGARIGDPMRSAAGHAELKHWLGVAPPDLSLVAKARASRAGGGADWVYSFMRSFYRDPSRPSGWNNALAPGTAMPHVLWQWQEEAVSGPAPRGGEVGAAGLGTAAAYDDQVADLVGFLVWAAEPGAAFRQRVGVGVLAFLLLLLVLSYLLKKEFWKNIR